MPLRLTVASISFIITESAIFSPQLLCIGGLRSLSRYKVTFKMQQTQKLNEILCWITIHLRVDC